MRGGRWFVAVAALLALVLRAAPTAHEIPRDVTVHAFVKAEGQRLRVLLRVPLGAMRDIQFPQTADGSLDLARADPFLRDAVAQWILPEIEILEEAGPVGAPSIAAVRVSLPSDRSFVSYEAAARHMSAAPPESRLAWQQVMLDVQLEYPIASEHARFSIRPGFARLGVSVATVLRFVTPSGIRAFEFHGDPGLVRLDPRWHQAAWQFVKLGFAHILDGADHLLFLLCLVIPFRRLRPLVIIVTAFTVAHSISLAAAAYDFVPGALWFPPLVEMLIAASILYVALENILSGSAPSRRWLVAFAFGLVHGFGFSFALKETMQFAGSHLLTSLLSFNVGVELGQLLVLAALVPALHLVFSYCVRQRIGAIVLSALVAHVAWHWTAERWSALRQFGRPSIEAVTLLMVTRGLLLVIAIAAIAWLIRRVRFSTVTANPDPGAAAPPPR